MLGVHLESWEGAMLRYDALSDSPAVALNAFPAATDYMAPFTREFMLNFGVDDLDAILARLAESGVRVIKRDDTDQSASSPGSSIPMARRSKLWELKAH